MRFSDVLTDNLALAGWRFLGWTQGWREDVHGGWICTECPMGSPYDKPYTACTLQNPGWRPWRCGVGDDLVGWGCSPGRTHCSGACILVCWWDPSRDWPESHPTWAHEQPVVPCKLGQNPRWRPILTGWNTRRFCWCTPGNIPGGLWGGCWSAVDASLDGS